MKSNPKSDIDNSASLIVTFVCFICLLIKILYATILLMVATHLGAYGRIYTVFDVVSVIRFGFE